MSLVQSAQLLLGFFCFYSDHIKQNEMGKAFSMYGKWEIYTKFLLGNLKGRDNSEDITWEDNIKMHVKQIVCAGVNYKQLAESRVQWQALVNVVMNQTVSWNGRNFLCSWSTVIFPIGSLTSWILLCLYEFWGFHGGGNLDRSMLWCHAFLWEDTNISEENATLPPNLQRLI